MKERIKQLRLCLGLTQRQFGEKIGMTNAAISVIEKGVNSVNSRMICMVCDKYNVNRKWLETGQGDMFLAPSTDDEKVEDVLIGNNKFAKILLHSIAKLSDDELIALEHWFNIIGEEYKKTGD